jgi:hypothetical protein
MSSDTEIEMMCDLLLVTIQIQNIIKKSTNIKSIKKKCLNRNLHKKDEDNETRKQILCASHLRIPR